MGKNNIIESKEYQKTSKWLAIIGFIVMIGLSISLFLEEGYYTPILIFLLGSIFGLNYIIANEILERKKVIENE